LEAGVHSYPECRVRRDHKGIQVERTSRQEISRERETMDLVAQEEELANNIMIGSPDVVIVNEIYD